MLGRHFMHGFFMDFIGLLVPLGWSMRGRSRFFLSRFSCGHFSIFGLRNWILAMHGLVELLDCLDAHAHFVLSCVRASWTWGFFNLFCALFLLPNVGEVYNYIISL